MAPSTVIAWYSSSDLWSLGSILCSNENSIVVVTNHEATLNSLGLVRLIYTHTHIIKIIHGYMDTVKFSHQPHSQDQTSSCPTLTSKIGKDQFQKEVAGFQPALRPLLERLSDTRLRSQPQWLTPVLILWCYNSCDESTINLFLNKSNFIFTIALSIGHSRTRNNNLWGLFKKLEAFIFN